jgi:glycosyltransferase involved in cell wall biosynthesis
LDVSTPFVFTAHGMLEPWLWNQQGLAVKTKKRLFWQLIAQPRLRGSTVVHAITPLERDHLTRLLPGCNVVVIPNAIDLDPAHQDSSQDREPILLFLGRIEPKKGVDILIRAFAQASLGLEWTLEVVGPSWSDAYMQALQCLVEECGLSRRVHFRGPLFGSAKQSLLERAWLMVAPSHSEVVGLVNLEAGAHWLPSITTHQTGLSDWMEGGGILINPDVDELAKALGTASSWSEVEQRARGCASRQLVERRYSWSAVTPMWQALYSDLTTSKLGAG